MIQEMRCRRPIRRLFSALALTCGITISVGALQSGAAITFTDVAERAGITFTHRTGSAGNKWYPELFGGGVAVLDIDGDRWPDLLFVNGKDWLAGSTHARHGLYRNNRNGTFTLTFGLGQDAAVSSLEVQWPSGRTQTFKDVAPNRTITIDESRGLLGR